jgi:ribose transport system permease protein
MRVIQNKLEYSIPQGARYAKVGNVFLRYGVIVAFALIVIISSILYPGFLLPKNLINIFSQLSIVGVMSIGMTFVMITGGFDMSVGGVYALSAVVVASLVNHHIPIAISMFLTLFVGAIVGLINGLLITRCRVPAFVATLGTGSIITGIAEIYTNGNPFFVQNHSFQWLGSGTIGLIPVSVFLLFFAYIIGGVILAYATYGRSLYAIGGNVEATKLSGLRVNLITTSTYVLCGICASISGIIISSRLGEGQANIGETIALDVIAAVVIGGTSLSGGEGSIWRTVIGGLVLAMLSNVFDTFSLSPYWQAVFKGAIIIAAVMFDYYARSKTKN